MTNKIPIIKVKSEVKKISQRNPLLRDVVCLIGGFETKIDEDDNTNIDAPVFFETLEAAEAVLYDGSETTLPDANKVLRQVFRENISGVLVVNISTFTGTTSKTWSRNLTATKLDDALASVRDIEFDILYCADELTDAFITTIDTEAKARFEAKKPFGYIGVGTRSSTAAYTTTAGKLGDYCYAYLTQSLEVNDTSLSLVESGAFLVNTIARLPVGQSLTAKVLDGVTDADDVTGLSSDDDYEDLVGLGFFVVRLINPMTGTYECVNSATANGLDLYINRVRDYIVNDFALRQYLGEKNNEITLQSLKTECNGLKTKFVDDLRLVENITYAVEKAATDKVNVILNTIQFADVITEIDVFITIEVV
jgi:hypothetical protein